MSMFLEIVYNIIAAVAAYFLTKFNSTYFLKGVAVERGYNAMGGEIIFVLLTFAAFYYSLYKLVKYIVKEIVSTFYYLDDDND